jgi:hypothetical protein
VEAGAPDCPKCGTPRTAQASCPRCGLRTDKMDSYARARDAAVPLQLVAAWDTAAAAWDDPKSHDTVIAVVAAHQAYAWAANRYRTRPGDPVAARQLERIRKAAEATMYAGAATRKDTAPKPYRAVTAVLAMLALAAGAGLLYATMMNGRGEPDPASATPAPPLPAKGK